MDVVQILILIAGAIIFTVSFFIPDKQVNAKEIREKEEKIIRELIRQELVEKELPKIQMRIDEMTEDSLERATQTTQRQMERITNEKMMAINEYSDTVMNEIHKNHEEAVFLYDMLNNKHAQVKTSTAELNQAIKESKQSQTAAKQTTKKSTKTKKDNKAVEKKVEIDDAPVAFEAITPEKVEVENGYIKESLELTPEEMNAMNDIWNKKDVPTPEDTGNVSGVEVLFASDDKDGNNNEKILELHKAGKSNMAIARELGLGIGEVKLVIDLFKGGM